MSERSDSRQSLNAGGAAVDMRAGTGFSQGSYLNPFEQEANPFTAPGDDKIFTFKDEERTRKEY